MVHLGRTKESSGMLVTANIFKGCATQDEYSQDISEAQAPRQKDAKTWQRSCWPMW